MYGLVSDGIDSQVPQGLKSCQHQGDHSTPQASPLPQIYPAIFQNTNVTAFNVKCMSFAIGGILEDQFSHVIALLSVAYAVCS